MDPLPADFWLGALVFLILACSVATWFGLFARWRQRGTLLDYEPRSEVPWAAPAAMLAVVFMAVSVYSTVVAAPPPERPEPVGPVEISERILGFILLQSAVVGAALFVVAVYYRASQRDLGLPLYTDELARDIWIGLVAWLAAVVPVYGVQLLFVLLFGPSRHPLVEMVTAAGPSVAVVLLATVAAVVVAPISEEILFRMLLQGWLEKWEDRLLARREESAPSQVAMANDEARMTSDEHAASGDEPFVIHHSSFSAEPPARGLAGLPHGWLPILISSLLFAVAHYGHGPDPIAIFVLALVLGYIYQRTHRIVPCIVAHAAFNSLAVIVLWRTVFVNSE